jgi:hypothetical protein
MSQRSRRHDPYPWTWEIPLATVLAILVLIIFGAHLGRAIANLVAGSDWRFPNRVDLFGSLPAVLRGDAAAGLIDLDGAGRIAVHPSHVRCRNGADLACRHSVVAQVGSGSLGARTNERRGDCR